MAIREYKPTSAATTADWHEPRELAFEEVADAIIRLSHIAATTLLEHACKGELASLLPYAVVAQEVPEFEASDGVVEAPDRALTDEEHERWLRNRQGRARPPCRPSGSGIPDTVIETAQSL